MWRLLLQAFLFWNLIGVMSSLVLSTAHLLNRSASPSFTSRYFFAKAWKDSFKLMKWLQSQTANCKDMTLESFKSPLFYIDGICIRAWSVNFECPAVDLLLQTSVIDQWKPRLLPEQNQKSPFGIRGQWQSLQQWWLLANYPPILQS